MTVFKRHGRTALWHSEKHQSTNLACSGVTIALYFITQLILLSIKSIVCLLCPSVLFKTQIFKNTFSAFQALINSISVLEENILYW